MSDDRVYSVNEVIASLDHLDGRTVQIACVLQIEFEGNSIWHTPTAKRFQDYGSSLWANFDYDAIGCEPQQLKQFAGRHVIIVAAIDRKFQGHFSLWPGSVTIRSIAKSKHKTTKG